VSALTFVLALLPATTAAGGFLVAAFSLGFYAWPAVLISLLVAVSAALALARPLEVAVTGGSTSSSSR
jgi:hypothetical protein